VISVSDLPTVNALLNSASALFLVTGYIFIRRRQVNRHKACMVAAFALSVAFLTSYVIYHAQVGSVPFRGSGWIRPVYFTILISHVSLAATVVPLAVVTLARALRGTFERHRRIARWTLPIWLYVSVTGVVVYWMVYHFQPVC
jgi:putative membrane protein